MNTSSYFRLASIALILFTVYLAYQPALTGTLFYDDFVNLGRLEQVKDFSSMIEFVFGGTAGPTGRPVALASFLLHVSDWPHNAANILRVNLFIHLSNGVLFLILANLILRTQEQIEEHRRFWIAFSAASLWLVMPLLASTNLIAVQRMTSLSAFFGLLGLIGFVSGYRWQQTGPKKALIIQLTSLGIGTLLATLTKENGALFPVYALIIDTLFVRKPAIPTWLKLARQIPLWAWLFSILFFLSPLVRDWTATDASFGWSPLARLQTEIVLLWKYLALAVAPQPTAFGPFHDDVQIITGWPVFVSIASFMIWLSIGFLLRRKTSWILFAVLWYLAGHLLESTVLPLELFFEHRNYLPIFGVCLCLAVSAWSLPGSIKKWGPVFFGVYIILQTAILYGSTTIWGNPLEAGENWVKRHPNSPRAILHLAAGYYEAYSNPSYALVFLDNTKGCNECIDVKMQALIYSCGFEEPSQTRQRFEDLEKLAKRGKASVALLDSLYLFHDLDHRSCPPLENRDLLLLTKNILNNPNFTATQYQIHALYHAAIFSDKLGLSEEALKYLRDAELFDPTVMPILKLQVAIYAKTNRPDQALAAIERRRHLANRSQTISDGDLDQLAAEIIGSQPNSDDSHER